MLSIFRSEFFNYFIINNSFFFRELWNASAIVYEEKLR